MRVDNVVGGICQALPRFHQRLVVAKLVIAREAYGDDADSGHNLGPGKIAKRCPSPHFKPSSLESNATRLMFCEQFLPGRTRAESRLGHWGPPHATRPKSCNEKEFVSGPTWTESRLGTSFLTTTPAFVAAATAAAATAAAAAGMSPNTAGSGRMFSTTRDQRTGPSE